MFSTQKSRGPQRHTWLECASNEERRREIGRFRSVQVISLELFHTTIYITNHYEYLICTHQNRIDLNVFFVFHDFLVNSITQSNTAKPHKPQNIKPKLVLLNILPKNDENSIFSP